MEACPRKRRRSWLLAGCSLLANPVQAAWPSLRAVWQSFPHAFNREHQIKHLHDTHHVTPGASAAASLGGNAPYSQPRHRRREPGHNADDNLKRIPLPSRVLEVKIGLHGRHGEWEACSPETCTQTRLVFCETLDSGIIVANDLCGEELPSARRECTEDDFATVCSATAAATAAREEASAAAVGEPAAGRNSPSGRSEPKPVQSSGPVTKATGPQASSTPGKTTTQGADDGKEETEGGQSADGSSLKERDSSAKEVSSRQQGETSRSEPLKTSRKPEDVMLASHQRAPALTRIGGSGPSRSQYRFWLVWSIGAGAVGSFLAVVVFAVRQYQKEQHRLRGIMPLNDFPQDNYINPFAKQLSELSEDDRSAFRL